MKEFLLASGNSHKAEEFAELFNKDLLVVTAAPEKIEVVEDGKSFQENALKKAEAYFNKFQTPIISDDSGLVVEALPGQLGIHSARFGGEGLNDKDRCELLIKSLKDQENKKAYFVCVLCFYLNPKEIYFFEGRCHGNISDELRGENGFGYDPLFMPEVLEGKSSFAEDLEWKMLNSHRSKASRMASQFFERQALN